MGEISDEVSKYLEHFSHDPEQIVQEILVSKPVHESELHEGDYVLFAQAQPIGKIQTQIFKIGQIIDGKLDNNVRAFKGVLENGTDGHIEFNLDSTLHIDKPQIAYPLAIYDWSAVLGDYTDANYKNGKLTLQWTNENPPDKTDKKRHILGINKPISVIIKGDPRQRPVKPGSALIHNKDTVDWEVEENHFKVTQRIPNGPKGSFSLPGYRHVSQVDYLFFEDIARI